MTLLEAAKKALDILVLHYDDRGEFHDAAQDRPKCEACQAYWRLDEAIQAEEDAHESA